MVVLNVHSGGRCTSDSDRNVAPRWTSCRIRVAPSDLTALASRACRSVNSSGYSVNGFTYRAWAMIIPAPPAARRRRYSMYGVAGRSGFLNISLAPCAVMTTRFLTSTGPSLMGDRIIDAEVTAPLPRFTKRCLINGAYPGGRRGGRNGSRNERPD